MQSSGWSKQLKQLMIILLVFPLLSGCWDRLEIEERAVVLGIAIDNASPKQDTKEETGVSHQNNFAAPRKAMLRLTAQLAVPGRISLGPATPGGGGGDQEQKPVWVVSVLGYTINDAMMNLQQQVADQLFLGHLRVIIIGESVAREGLEDLSDYLRRNSEVRRTAWMMVAKDAADLMRTAPPLERIPTLYLLNTMDHAVQMGKFPNDFVGVFWSATASRGQDPFLPYVEVKQKDNVRIAGLAYFSGDRLVGITDPLEIGFYMLLKGVNPAGYTSYKRIPGTDTFVMFRATWRSVKTNVKIENGLPHFLIEAHEEGEIDEKYGKTLGLDKEAQIKAIEKQLAKGADRALKAFIQETQAKESDILGLGEYVRAKQPKYWNEHVKTAEEWHKIYRNLSIEVKTQFSIRRVGMKAR